MPTSHHQQISKIVELIILLNPQAVLDIGVGFGKYGMLCREYLELWDGREDYRNFKRRIDGIEIFKEYLTPIHDFVYDHIYTGEASKVIGTLSQRYELVLLIDVLEHFTKSEGKKFVKKILSKHDGILLSTPKDIGDQKEVFENIHETHRSQWSKKELAAFGPAFFLSDDVSHIAYIGKKAKDLAKVHRAAHLKQFIKTIPGAKRLYRAVKRG
jgi:hypothetical protein